MIKGKYYVIDSHCHIYPEKIASLAINHTDEFYSEHSHCKGTIEDLLKNGEKTGIDKFIVQSVATSKYQVKKINQFIANQVNENLDKLVGLGTIHPESDNIEEDIDFLISLGLKGFKIHPDIQGFKLDHNGYLKAFEIASERGLPVLMHTGDNRYDNSNPNRLIPILKKYKNLKVVGAHYGGWSIWEDASKVYNEFENFYVDCSSSMPYLTFEKCYEISKRYGADKILFGTDYPMWEGTLEIENLLKMDFTEQELKKIFSENAIKLYGLN